MSAVGCINGTNGSLLMGCNHYEDNGILIAEIPVPEGLNSTNKGVYVYKTSYKGIWDIQDRIFLKYLGTQGPSEQL